MSEEEFFDKVRSFWRLRERLAKEEERIHALRRRARDEFMTISREMRVSKKYGACALSESKNGALVLKLDDYGGLYAFDEETLDAGTLDPNEVLIEKSLIERAEVGDRAGA